MPTTTPRLALIKPAIAGEVIDVSQINANSDNIDLNAGYRVCTSTTRPAAPYVGMQIFETDTKITSLWDGVGWALTSPLLSWINSGDVFCVAGGTVINAPVALPALPHATRVYISVDGIAGNAGGASAVAIDVTLVLNSVPSLLPGTYLQVPAAAGAWSTVTRTGYVDVPANVTASVGTKAIQSVGSCHFALSLQLTRVNN